ncbi:unnamed protein product [Lactuca saligna]|uniref:Uncharacterized protein n=1 Tax=Lactuca saligna TaxID=75948 RepID=A0AA35ZAB6_LACSI|nr:unnamed protein product [Lactuca saligna]
MLLQLHSNLNFILASQIVSLCSNLLTTPCSANNSTGGKTSANTPCSPVSQQLKIFSCFFDPKSSEAQIWTGNALPLLFQHTRHCIPPFISDLQPGDRPFHHQPTTPPPATLPPPSPPSVTLSPLLPPSPNRSPPGPSSTTHILIQSLNNKLKLMERHVQMLDKMERGSITLSSHEINSTPPPSCLFPFPPSQGLQKAKGKH